MDNYSNRIPNTVISKSFVAEIVRDLCHFAANFGQNAAGGGQMPSQKSLSSLAERTKLLHDLCECEPELAPYLIAEFAPIFRAIVGAFASHFDASQNGDDQQPISPVFSDQILCHFLSVLCSLITSDFGTFFDDIHSVDHFLSLCFASIGQMNANSMTVSLNCLVRFLSSLRFLLSSVPLSPPPPPPPFISSASLRVVAHFSAANFADLAAFVLQNSLNANLICSLWQFLHAMSTDEITAVALSDLIPSLVPLISADPSILSRKFPRATNAGGGEEKPLALLTLSNFLLHIPSANCADFQQMSALLQNEIGKGNKAK